MHPENPLGGAVCIFVFCAIFIVSFSIVRLFSLSIKSRRDADPMYSVLEWLCAQLMEAEVSGVSSELMKRSLPRPESLDGLLIISVTALFQNDIHGVRPKEWRSRLPPTIDP